jgi:UDP-glucose 4-epimerase
MSSSGTQPIWLVTGGAGYIGSHTVRALMSEGHIPVVLDDLSTGLTERLPPEVEVVEGRCQDSSLVERLMRSHKFAGVVHLAAFKQARESTSDPLRYWGNNVTSLLGVLQAMAAVPTQHFILSSSCSVLGAAPDAKEETPPNPQSPYARTKLVSEWILQDCSQQLGFDWCSIRYFNVIGRDSSPFAGDSSPQALVPSIKRALRADQAPRVFGDNFDTPDGTAIRDYIDVRDLARAHALVADALLNPVASTRLSGRAIHVSSGRGISVGELIKVAKSVRPELRDPVYLAAKSGDPSQVWARPSPSLQAIGWSAKYSLRDSLESELKSRAE